MTTRLVRMAVGAALTIASLIPGPAFVAPVPGDGPQSPGGTDPAASMAVLGSVPVALYPSQIAVDPTLHRVYVLSSTTPEAADTITVIDGDRSTVLRAVAVGPFAYGLAGGHGCPPRLHDR